MSDPAGWYALAKDVLGEAEELFAQGIGAAPANAKGRGDFATQVDLDIEQLLRQRLAKASGFPVMGEEFGGTICSPVWVVDPIDGTSNYSAGNPMSAILVSLLVCERPVVGIASMPLTGQFFGAYEGSELETALRDRQRGHVAGHVGCSTMTSQSASSQSDTSPLPGVVGSHGGAVELSQSARLRLLDLLASRGLRPRITGSVGVDLAYAAAGIFSASVSLSPNIWDNAAGVVLGRAAGMEVTDLHGNPWQLGARGAVIGSPSAHAQLVACLRDCQHECEP